MAFSDIVKRPPPRTKLDYWRDHRIDVVLWPAAWLDANKRIKLEWKKVRFTASNQENVDAVRGIYAFSVSIDAPNLPPNSCIVYIGISGDRDPRTLRERYGDYVRELRRGKSKRPLIDDMLRLWGRHLDFWFAAVPDNKIDLNKIEAQLNSTVVTPLVINDFMPTDRPVVKQLRYK